MEFYQKRWRVMLGIIVLAGLIYACVIIFTHAAEFAAVSDNIFLSTPGGIKLFAIFAIILFGLLGIPAIKSIINPKLALKITDEGFYTPTYGFIEWDNIVSIEPMPISMFTKFIKFYVRDFSKVQANMSNLSKILMTPDGERCSINLGGTGADFNMVYNIMLVKWQAVKNTNI